MEQIGKIIDPLGLMPTDNSRRRDLLDKAKSKYMKFWLEGTKKGYPMELLGFPRKAELLAIGAGGAPIGMPGIPAFPLPNLLTPREIGVTNEELKTAEEQADNIERTVNDIDEGKQQFDEAKHSHGAGDTAYEEPDDNDILGAGGLGGAGGGGYRREPLRVRPPPRYVREVLNPHYKSSKAARKFAEENKVAESNRIRDLVSQVSTVLGISASGAISDSFSRNTVMTRAVLLVLNRAGIEVGTKRTGVALNVLKRSIIQRTGIENALLWNDILDAMQSNTDDTKIRRLPRVNTRNLSVAPVGANLTPIDEVTQERIGQAMVSQGVPNMVAARTARRIVSRIKALTKELEGKFGGKDIALDLANGYIKQVMEEIIDSLDEDRHTSRINTHNVFSTILSILFESKQAIMPKFKGFTLSAFKNIIKDINKNLGAKAPEPRMPAFTAPVGAVGEMFDHRLDEHLPTPQEGVDYITERAFRNDEQRRITYNPLPHIDGLPSANVIVRNARQAARLIQGWGAANNIANVRGIVFRLEPPNPDDPDDPPGGGDNIIMEVPRGIRRRFSIRTFVQALLILGSSAVYITGLLDSLRRGRDYLGYGKNKTIVFDPVTGKPTITDETPNSKFAPKDPNDDSEVPTRKINTDPRVGGATYLEKTQIVEDYGLSDQVDNYNTIASKFNEAIKARDLPAIDRLKKELDVAFTPIRNTIVRADRPDTFTEIPDPGTSLGLGKAMGDRNSLLNYIQGPTTEGAQLQMLKLTPEMEEMGLKDMVTLANKYISIYNTASKKGDHDTMIEMNSRLNNLAQWIQTPRVMPAETSPESIEEANKSQIELEDAIKNYEIAKQSGASPDILNKMILNIQELKSYYILKRKQAPTMSESKTYLRSDQFRKEVFPQTPEQTRKFNELQRLEQFLTVHVNPNDEGNSALKEYHEFIDSIDDSLMGASYNPMLYYQTRIDAIKNRLLFHQIDPKIIKQLEEEESVINTDETGDDPETNVNISESGVIETVPDVGTLPGRADMVMGGDANKIIQTKSDLDEEDRLWREYSLVKPGHGNGGVNKNSLFRHSINDERLRYNNLRLPTRTHPEINIKKTITPDRTAPASGIRKNIYHLNYPFLPTGYRGNEQFQFTPERLHTPGWGEFENSNNTYQPELVLNKYTARPTRIIQMRNDGLQFAPYTYTNGEADVYHRVPAVSREHIPFNNARGFPSSQRLDVYDYHNARKSNFN